MLGLPTLWVSHSYAACGQHAPDEHMPGSVAQEGLAMMVGPFLELGAEGAEAEVRRRTDVQKQTSADVRSDRRKLRLARVQG